MHVTAMSWLFPRTSACGGLGGSQFQFPMLCLFLFVHTCLCGFLNLVVPTHGLFRCLMLTYEIVHHGGAGRTAGVGGSWSYYIHNQEADSEQEVGEGLSRLAHSYPLPPWRFHLPKVLQPLRYHQLKTKHFKQVKLWQVFPLQTLQFGSGDVVWS